MIKYYEPAVVQANDYYPFGIMMLGRSWEAGSGYRFGFNGKENTNEVFGDGNAVDFGARVYDARLGRWFSTDPLFFNYPHLSPYIFVDSDPINSIDPNGMDIVEINMQYKYGERKGQYKDGYSTFARTPSGSKFLSKFTNGHDTGVLGPIGPFQKGALSNHTLEISAIAEGNGYAGYSEIYLEKGNGERVALSMVSTKDIEEGVKLVFQIVVAVADKPEDANEIGHEAFVHLSYRVELIENNVLDRLNVLTNEEIASELNAIGRMPNTYLPNGEVISGGEDHKRLKSGKANDFIQYIKELGSILSSEKLKQIKQDNDERNKSY